MPDKHLQDDCPPCRQLKNRAIMHYGNRRNHSRISFHHYPWIMQMERRPPSFCQILLHSNDSYRMNMLRKGQEKVFIFKMGSYLIMGFCTLQVLGDVKAMSQIQRPLLNFFRAACPFQKEEIPCNFRWQHKPLTPDLDKERDTLAIQAGEINCFFYSAG